MTEDRRQLLVAFIRKTTMPPYEWKIGKQVAVWNKNNLPEDQVTSDSIRHIRRNPRIQNFTDEMVREWEKNTSEFEIERGMADKHH